MAKRVKITTKTTRNKEFNSYETGGGNTGLPYVLHTVTSTTATKATPNIKLLDVNEAIIKTGKVIAEDAFNNTTLIEASLDVDTKTAKKLYRFATEPPTADSAEYKEYLYYGAVLEASGLSYNNIKSWIINYKNGNSLNKEAGIQFNQNTKYSIFGAPEQVVLNNRQHYNNCGIESTLNNLAMAGFIKMNENLSDQESVENDFLQNILERNLAEDSGEIGILDTPDGGTIPDDYRDILQYYGIDSTAYYITSKADEYVYLKYDNDAAPTVNNIYKLAYKISQGYGAVVGVSSDALWHDAQSESGGDNYKIDHAIALTGVVYATDTPNENTPPVGFYIHDTGAWMTRFISYDEFIEATLCDYTYGEDDPEHKTLSTLKEYDTKRRQNITKDRKGIFITITDEPIKNETFNLNVTGDKFNNILWGNNSNNLVKGMAGNDTLYGRGGNDSIYGGAGNDVIVGNNAYKLKVEDDFNQINIVNDFKAYLNKAGIQDTIASAALDNIELTDYGTLTIDQFIDSNEIVPYGINNIYGESGNDIIIGGEQADLIYGGAGNDYIWGSDGRNAIYGGAGNDFILGGYDNDKLVGDAGNDYILGLEDNDIIDGGAGNDTIIGGDGVDFIQTGAGNDVVCFEGTKFGQDEILSKSGTTTFKFIDDEDDQENGAASSANDLFFSLEKDEENEKVSNLVIKYTPGGVEDEDSLIKFDNYFNIKSGGTKSLIIDADDEIYNVTASNRSKVTVSNTKTTGATKINGKTVGNENINNILLTTNRKGTTITTSDKNDIVTMITQNDNVLDKGIDKITYTRGVDKYVSEDRDTYYTVTYDITHETSLYIYDNLVGLEKVVFNEDAFNAAMAINSNVNIENFTATDENYTSSDDRLYFTDTKKANYLFDVGIDNEGHAITTENSGLFLVGKYSTTLTRNTAYKNITTENAESGFIYMEHFFDYDYEEEEGTLIAKTDNEYNFYGNGQIEGFYYKDSEEAYDYNMDITSIASAVASWLNGYNGEHVGNELHSAFEAFEKLDAGNLTSLVAAYSPIAG